MKQKLISLWEGVRAILIFLWKTNMHDEMTGTKSVKGAFKRGRYLFNFSKFISFLAS